MYSFEGDFRRKPLQSLRGASRKEEKDVLIKRAQKERQKRENARQRTESAIVIQSSFRSYLARRRQMLIFRNQFDQSIQNIQQNSEIKISMLFTLARKLCYFFNPASDGNRLIWVCQAAVKKKEEYIKYILQNKDSGVFQIKHLLLLCLRYLKAISTTQSPIAIPMRMLEVFTMSDSYSQTGQHHLSQIWTFLIQKGFFQLLRSILEMKVPSNLEKSPNPPTPIAEGIFNLIISPISYAAKLKNKHFSDFVLGEVCRSLLCPAYSEQVGQFLLPAMAYGKFPFPFVDLIQALILQTSDTAAGEPKSKAGSQQDLMTPWLLCSVLTFADKCLDTLSIDNSVSLLLLIGRIVPCLPSRYRHDDDSDSDDDDDMDTDDQMQGTGSFGLEDVGLDSERILNSQKFLHCILKCLKHKMEPQLITSVCTICHALMTKLHCSIHKLRLLYSLAFNKTFIRSLWYTCVSVSNVTVTGSQITLLQTLSRGLAMTTDDINRIVPLLSVFCAMYSHSLYTLHDADFYGDSKDEDCSMPFSLTELVPMTLMLRDTCLGIIELAHPDARLSVSEDYREALRLTGVKDRQQQREEEEQHTRMWAYLFKVIATLVRQLYSRDTRRSFCPRHLWLSDRVHIQADKPSQIYRAQGSVFTRRPFGTMKSLTKVQIDDDGPPLSNTDVKNLVILTELPFVVSFEERVKILQKLIQRDREENQGDLHHFLSGPSVNVLIRRNFIYEDAYDKLSPENEPNLKLKMRVQLVNAAGLDEAGIDGGGIFREFLSELLKTGFDPNRGLFAYTTDRLLYPNPQSAVLMENYTKHFYFLGRMLGKAIYENMLVELPFASFFLSKILSRHGGDLDIHHLASLDPEMYRNLLSLKTYDGDVSDLNLDFTAVNDNFGETRVEELKPGGQNIPVNSNNKIEYIHLMADYKINKQIRNHCVAFRHGMSDLINLEWLRMFDHHELQVLISGASIPINIDDLKKHTNYSGGYNVDHPVIRMFWNAVESFTDDQKRKLLKFVTSCSRPPLLGFKDLYPPFCVHYGGNESDRLPSSSTCMNLLKLPEFKDDQTMKTKLLYACESGTGFELS